MDKAMTEAANLERSKAQPGRHRSGFQINAGDGAETARRDLSG
jgi:hypothetical protein